MALSLLLTVVVVLVQVLLFGEPMPTLIQMFILYTLFLITERLD